MKFKYTIFLLILILAGCNAGLPQATLTPSPSPTATLASPIYSVTRAPDPQNAAQVFLQAWKDEDYAGMYSLLTGDSQTAISEADFEKRYRDVAVNLTLTTLEYQLDSWTVNPSSGAVGYQVTFHTTLFGDITPASMAMNFSLVDGAWRVQWDDGLIMPQLKNGNKLHIVITAPSRGTIYDRDGNAIASQTDYVALGVIPSQLDPDQHSTLLYELSLLTGLTRSYIQDLYESAYPDSYVAIGETSAEEYQSQIKTLSGLSGLQVIPSSDRYYADGGIAPQTIGYVQAIPAEELEAYQRKGYSIGQKVGMAGLEYWAEPYLAGSNGAVLYVVDSAGNVLSPLARIDPIPGQSIYTTIDSGLQARLQNSLGDYRGAVVVMERDTGAVLAMVSNPGFDPNLFDLASNSYYLALLGQVIGDPNHPLYDRADMGQYPLGSVFKIITMSAALETGVYTAQTTYNCGYYFTDPQGTVLHDWTLDHDVPPSGLLTLPQGLMRSCNPFFWSIGQTLYDQGYTTAVSDMARAFGLGSKTGFELQDELAGNIPDPVSDSDAVQLAIGQGSTLVTPLQVADFISAVGNGGTLFKPQLIDKIVALDGSVTQEFTPVVNGTLPISAENLKIVQAAMVSVVSNPRGTAYSVMRTLHIPVAGKTGTATTSEGDPDAWFAGYTMDNNPDKLDIAIAVLLENAGEGSEMAAPIFRRVVSLYFSDNSNYGYLMPWEASPYVVASPTPIVVDTATSEPGAAESPTSTP